MKMISLNWIYKYGLKVVEKEDIEEPILFVPSDLFIKLKEEVEHF